MNLNNFERLFVLFMAWCLFSPQLIRLGSFLPCSFSCKWCGMNREIITTLHLNQSIADQGKCFTYVTKTIANLTTYSRKPGDYNGTIIFEIDIMKNFSPINLNLCQTWLFHKFLGCFFCFDLLLLTVKLNWECWESSRKEVLFWFRQWQKMWILNWVGMSFLWYQSQK